MFPNERRRHLSCYREVRDVRNSPASWGIFQCRHLTSQLTHPESVMLQLLSSVISQQPKHTTGLTASAVFTLSDLRTSHSRHAATRRTGGWGAWRFYLTGAESPLCPHPVSRCWWSRVNPSAENHKTASDNYLKLVIMVITWQKGPDGHLRQWICNISLIFLAIILDILSVAACL